MGFSITKWRLSRLHHYKCIVTFDTCGEVDGMSITFVTEYSIRQPLNLDLVLCNKLMIILTI